MRVFNRIGRENYYDSAARRPASSETDKLGTTWENIKASAQFILDEELSISRALTLNPLIIEQLDKLRNITAGTPDDINNTRNRRGRLKPLSAYNDLIVNLQKTNPNAGLKTYDQVLEGVSLDLGKKRDYLQKLKQRSSSTARGWGAGAGMGTYLIDPFILATIPFSGGWSAGRGILGNAWRGAKTEMKLAAGSETVATPFVFNWKQQIKSDFDLKDAAIRIMTATLGAGVIRAGASTVIDLTQLAKAKKILRDAGKTKESNILDEYARLVNDAPAVREKIGLSGQDTHILAQAKVAQAFEKGDPVSQKELDEILGSNESQKVDPREIQVDAETFQYKADTDEFGVSDALKGVTKWEPMKADSILVWERKDGVRFVADGHQRLALAKRLIGDDAQEVGLSAFILREKDGFSSAFAREYAALRNIADNKGTAIDAAKVLKGAGKGVEDLPPNSALFKDAQGLAKLDDAAFRMVIDDVIGHKYGAIVGELIEDGIEQAAVIRALAKSKPANTFQARLMVEDMKAAGFSTTKTDDLFGGVEITESLFKERAKVIDSTVKKLKKDKQVFRTLAEQESKISEAGNILDTQANIARLSDDEKTLATLSALANTKGPVSDAINAAARRVKDGETVAKATKDLLPEIKRAVERGDIDVTKKADQPETINLVEEDITPLEKIVNPIDPKLSNKKKLAQIDKLTEENVVIVDRLIKKVDEKFGTESGWNKKEHAKIIEKAKRPSILAAKPWHGVEHLRDTFRFKTVINDFRDVPGIFDELLKEGVGLIKKDTGKLFNPKEWGWRIVVFDLRMPNGQIVEWYLPIRELEVEKKLRGHLVFDQWRNKTEKQISAQQDKYWESVEKSFRGYDEAFSAALARLGMSRKEAAASWSKAESSLDDALLKSASSSGITTPILDHVPSSPRKGATPLTPKSKTALGVPSSTKANVSDVIDKSSINIITSLEAFENVNPALSRLALESKTLDEFLEKVKKSKAKSVQGVSKDDLKYWFEEINKAPRASEQFIRLASKKEASSPAEKRRAFQAIPDKDGYEKIYKPYGEQGRGFYYKPINKAKMRAEIDQMKAEIVDTLSRAKALGAKPYKELDDIADELGLDTPPANKDNETSTVYRIIEAQDKINQPVIKTGEIEDLDNIRINEAQQLIDEVGDIEVVNGVRSSGKGDVELEFKSAKEVFKEIDNEQKIVDDLFNCVGGKGG